MVLPPELDNLGEKSIHSDQVKGSSPEVDQLKGTVKEQKLNRPRRANQTSLMTPSKKERSRKNLSIFGHEQMVANHTDLIGKF